ncbi:ribonuclease H-like domain-containing protein [Kallotenue papyrolyticum]|uniref:ribonuclease H-like domain-containing protein n=1 Tax=Kallotenue papyrolyticum TaxID=1325125 RepID=UPI0004785A92|nr:ribonuclease H-like domain-containing protein [Kallotenue papyrolyticum]
MHSAYLDIETAFDGAITVIGIYRPDSGTHQLVGAGVHDVNLYRALEGVTTIYTYNGGRFDLPVIRRRLLVDLARDFRHHDLMFDCWRQGLKGGLKKVELQLGIVRGTQGLSGWDAPRLWQRYVTYDDRAALELLLRYNRDDVVYLPRLRAYLQRQPEEPLHEAVQLYLR